MAPVQQRTAPAPNTTVPLNAVPTPSPATNDSGK